MGILDREPGDKVRQDSAEKRQKRAQDHQDVTESPRWGEAGNSERERGYPREGGETPAQRSREDANKPDVVRRPNE
ncbi:MAG: hypothetical protein ACJ790_05495 [Myxococcaceae bacterium]